MVALLKGGYMKKNKLIFKSFRLQGEITMKARTKEELKWMQDTFRTALGKALEGWKSWHLIKGKEETRKIIYSFNEFPMEGEVKVDKKD